MTDLAAWLLEQIAEDERVTDGADWEWLGPWELEKNHALGPGDAMYYAMVTPRRTKAECDAKRQIVARCEELLRFANQLGNDGPELAERTLRLLALPLAGRPGYREEWRP